MNKEDKKWYMLGVFLGTIFGIMISITVFAIKDTPSAMDVYQGKTTLEITYRDGVAIDSVVVFKDNIK